MTVEENYQKLELSLKATVGTLGVLGVSEKHQELLLKLLRYDIDNAFLNGNESGYSEAIDYSTQKLSE